MGGAKELSKVWLGMPADSSGATGLQRHRMISQRRSLKISAQYRICVVVRCWGQDEAGIPVTLISRPCV